MDMSTAHNQTPTESRSTHARAPISQETAEDAHDRRAASYNAMLIERRLRGDREDVTWSAVLGYN